MQIDKIMVRYLGPDGQSHWLVVATRAQAERMARGMLETGKAMRFEINYVYIKG